MFLNVITARVTNLVFSPKILYAYLLLLADKQVTPDNLPVKDIRESFKVCYKAIRHVGDQHTGNALRVSMLRVSLP